jgi:hypothetical protein
MAEKYEGPERRAPSLLHSGVSVADVVSIATSVITALGIGVPLVFWGGKMDARMTSVETRAERTEALQSVTDKRQDETQEVVKRELREEIREVNRKLDVLINRR